MKRMKKTLAGLLAAALVLSLAACGGGEQSGSEQTDSEQSDDGGQESGSEQSSSVQETEASAGGRESFTIAMGADPGDMSPYGNNAQESFFVRQNIYETLFTYSDETGEQVPLLAESWEVDETGLITTYHLRENAMDSEGNAFTASDVLYSLNQAAATDAVTAIFTAVIDMEACEAIDEHTVKIVMNEPGVSALAKLSKIFMVTEASYEASPDKMVTTPIGTGPYKLTELIQGSSVAMTRNENYWGGEPQIKDVKFQIISEESQRTTALVTGEVDYIYDCPIRDMEYISGTDGYAAYEMPVTDTYGFYMNCGENSPLSNEDLRKAVCLAIDNQVIADTVYSGHASAATASESMACIEVEESYGNSEYYSYNLDKAKEYLEASGYDTSNPLRLAAKTTLNLDRVAEVLQSMLGQIGLSVEITMYETSVYAQLILDEPEKWDFVLSEWITLTGYGADSLQMILGIRNYCHLDEATSQDMFDLAVASMTSSDAGERQKATEDLYARTHEECWIYGIVNPTNKYAAADYVENIHYYGAKNLAIHELVLSD